jgi:hypothetical protein
MSRFSRHVPHDQMCIQIRSVFHCPNYPSDRCGSSLPGPELNVGRSRLDLMINGLGRRRPTQLDSTQFDAASTAKTMTFSR